jgi:pimeloyl-ACP methyl ester carboxylesterase
LYSDGVRTPTSAATAARVTAPAPSRSASAAAAIVARVGGDVLLVPDAGHYPHVEVPGAVLPRILDHVRAGACHPAG